MECKNNSRRQGPHSGRDPVRTTTFTWAFEKEKMFMSDPSMTTTTTTQGIHSHSSFVRDHFGGGVEERTQH